MKTVNNINNNNINNNINNNNINNNKSNIVNNKNAIVVNNSIKDNINSNKIEKIKLNNDINNKNIFDVQNKSNYNIENYFYIKKNNLDNFKKSESIDNNKKINNKAINKENDNKNNNKKIIEEESKNNIIFNNDTTVNKNSKTIINIPTKSKTYKNDININNDIINEKKERKDNINNEINNNYSDDYESCQSEFEDNMPKPLPDYENVKKLVNDFYIKQTPGEGNCLFYALSYLIFKNFNYHVTIRQKICDYLENNIIKDDDADIIDERKEIQDMRNDGVYGTEKEINAFCNLCEIRITCYTRIINNNKKEKTDKLIKNTYGEIYEEKFALMLSDYGKDNDLINHFEALEHKNGYNIDKNKLQNIKEKLCNINSKSINKNEEMKKCEVEIISGKTGKKVESRKGDSIWNLYIPLSRRNNEKNSYKNYTVTKFNKDLTEKVEYKKVTKLIPLSEIINSFDNKNIIENGINTIIDNCKNILIDEINGKKITNKLMNEIMNINDERAKKFNNCICYECSGLNGKGNPAYRIYNSLYELKNHCLRYHNGSLDKCIINYRLVRPYIEIEVKKDSHRYIIHEDHLLRNDKIDYLKNKKDKKRGGNIISNINKIKIYGENIRTFNEMNRGLLSDVLDNNRPDFILLNECNIGKASFKMSGYKLELSDNNEVGILYKDIYYLNKSFEELEDNYNIIRMVNTNNGNLIIYCTYIPPGEEHNKRTNELIEKLLLLKRNYKSLSLILFGDLNIKREKIKEKIIDKIEPFGFKVWYNKEENIYTHEQKIGNKIIKSYLDYMITYGIDNISFDIKDNLVYTDHKCLELIYLEDENRKLNRIKETIEPYIRVYKKSDEIKNELIEVFKSEVPEIKLLRLIHDNKFKYKVIKKKFTFRTNLIKEISKQIKELQKKGDYYAINKIIKRHRTEKWELFLKELYELRVANNVKEYFLRLKFYTYINKNTDILKNLKIIKNGNEIITLNKEEINNEILIKYKDLLGDKGYKDIYYTINDKVITITKDDIKYAHENVVKNKAVSWDLIPGISLKNSIKPEYYDIIKDILNRYLIPGVIPEEITTSRLFCLNKKANEPGNVNNLRPIAISSTILKIIESAVLTRLLKEINDKNLINKKQIGFIRGCGTELNLLRLRQRVYDIKRTKTQYTKYLLFIDLKNAYDKVNHRRLFLKLSQLGINKEIIGTIKLLYSKAKLKISSNSENINVNNGVLQGSLISPMLFDLYINDLINELDKNSFEVLAYADDLCVLCDGRNQLINVLKIIDKWTELNDIKVNKSKSGIMILKNNIEKNDNIDGYPIINEYKYLGIIINDKMNIQKHIGNIDKKLDEYFQRNYVLNKKYFSVKSILLIFGYFHKSRLLYGLPAFIDQKSKIKRIDNIMSTNIKKLLKLPMRTNTERLKIALGLPNLNIYLIQRLIKLKIKYENIFKEKLTMYDKTIKDILNINDISQVRTGYNYLYNNLKTLGKNEELNINQGFIQRLKHRIYSWYVNSDFILLKFMCHRGSFREDINKKCILCKNADNGIKHVINECEKLKIERNILLGELNEINNTKYEELLKAIEYHYYSKRYSNTKAEAKKDNKGIKLIKEFLLTMYKKFGAENNKRDDE